MDPLVSELNGFKQTDKNSKNVKNSSSMKFEITEVFSQTLVVLSMFLRTVLNCLLMSYSFDSISKVRTFETHRKVAIGT
jgi:hypothetical protein